MYYIQIDNLIVNRTVMNENKIFFRIILQLKTFVRFAWIIIAR
jgi:hypothetical protein